MHNWWMDALDDVYADHPCVDWYKTTEEKKFSTLFKKDWFLHLMITNFENASSHKYFVQKANSLWMARSEMTV